MVIGAGVVGLATARALSLTGYQVFIIEQHSKIGTEVSSRNSGVIHAGLYYAESSNKALCCAQGSKLLYDYCYQSGIPHKKVQKLIVATNIEQRQMLKAIQKNAASNNIFLDWISGAEAEELEPNLRATSALLSPNTGIVDVHSLMYAYLADAEALGAVFSTNTHVQSIVQLSNSVVVQGKSLTESFDLELDFVINAAGLGAYELAQQYWPHAPKPKNKLAKGNYFSISGATPFERLIYPIPENGGLGIHYTMDLNGRSRLGPNVRWVDNVDYQVDLEDEQEFIQAVRAFWPGVDDCTLSPDYCGFRPKIAGDDFVIERRGGIVTLLGIESPGLTSSLAIAEQIVGLII